MHYRIFDEMNEHYYPYAYNETDFERVKDCVSFMLKELYNNGDVDEDQRTESMSELNGSNEDSFPFHPSKTVCEVYSIERSESEFVLNDIPEHMMEYVGKSWR
jgi:hypothetical protein